jgi:lipopolysaccharide transport system permease protein
VNTELPGGDITLATDSSTPPADPELTETLIEPSSGWQPFSFGEIWRYRELLFFLIWRDVKVRYKQTALGAAWAVFQPLLLMAVFWLFLGRVAKVPAGELPYPLFLFAGLLPWFLFATAATSAASSLINSEQLITKVYFPRLVIPFGATGPAVLDFAVSLMALAVLMGVFRETPAFSAVLLPLAIGLIMVTALGVGTFLAALNVAYRDFRYVVPFMIQAWLFATPSIYLATGPNTATPELVRWIMAANPMTGLIEFFRAALFGGAIDWVGVGISGLLGAALFLVGCLYFRRMESSFADVI